MSQAPATSPANESARMMDQVATMMQSMQTSIEKLTKEQDAIRATLVKSHAKRPSIWQSSSLTRVVHGTSQSSQITAEFRSYPEFNLEEEIPDDFQFYMPTQDRWSTKTQAELDEIHQQLLEIVFQRQNVQAIKHLLEIARANRQKGIAYYRKATQLVVDGATMLAEERQQVLQQLQSTARGRTTQKRRSKTRQPQQQPKKAYVKKENNPF